MTTITSPKLPFNHIDKTCASPSCTYNNLILVCVVFFVKTRICNTSIINRVWCIGVLFAFMNKLTHRTLCNVLNLHKLHALRTILQY